MVSDTQSSTTIQHQSPNHVPMGEKQFELVSFLEQGHETLQFHQQVSANVSFTPDSDLELTLEFYLKIHF
jgi:hypothetical protein